MIVGGKDHTWTGVGVACDPRAVDREHHQEHEHQHGHNAFDVGAQALFRFLLLCHMLPHFTCLKMQSKQLEALILGSSTVKGKSGRILTYQIIPEKDVIFYGYWGDLLLFSNSKLTLK